MCVVGGINRGVRICFILIFVPITILFILELCASVHWGLVLDSPIITYIGYLIHDHHYVPYRDIFDVNLPGIYAFSIALGKFLGYGDSAFRWVDISSVILLGVMTWFVMRQFGNRIALLSAVLFSVVYLRYGPTMSLQRDYLALIFIVAGFVTVRLSEQYSRTFCAFGLGICFGIVTLIKPQLVVGWPVLLFGIINLQARHIFATLLGFLLPITTAVYWLWSQDALGAWWDIARHYWPLYSHITGFPIEHEFVGKTQLHQVLTGMDQLIYKIISYGRFGGDSYWVIVSLFGYYLALNHATLSESAHRYAVLCLKLAVIYSLSPLLGTQFLNYHWLPFKYFLVLGCAFIFLPVADTQRWLSIYRGIAIMALAWLIATHLAPYHVWSSVKNQLQQGEQLKKHERYIDEISQYLIQHTKPFDTVQPLDWTQGAVHAMLLARVPIATPFIYEISFYHDVSHPYIQGLRRQFIRALHQAKPRYLLRMPSSTLWVSGTDTSRDFPALTRFIQQYYYPAKITSDYIIYERSSV